LAAVLIALGRRKKCFWRKKMTVLKKMILVFVMASVAMLFTSGAYGKTAAAETAVEKTAAVAKDNAASKLININTADSDKLMKLPRIGPKMAQRIIDFRKENGKFKRIEDIMKVKGIGEKTFKGFEDKITI